MVVAEELHFSKAAARVFMAQQALSREIKGLEHDLGVRLLERTSRKVTLTPAGEIFLRGARAMLEAFDGTTADTQRAGHGLAGTLRLGYVPGAALELTPLIMAAFREQHPDVVIEMHEFAAGDPSAGLASGVSDVAFLRLPQGTAHIDSEILFVDPVVAMVSASHRHAGRGSVSARDLLDDPITLSDTADETYRAFWSLDAVRDESTPATVVPVGSVTEEAQLVAAGVAVAVTSAAAADYMRAPGVRFLPIDDWPGSATAVAWPDDDPSPAVARFIDVARAVRDRETGVVDRIEKRVTSR